MLGDLISKFDTWFNTLTGFGTERDRTRGSRFIGDTRIDDKELTDLFRFSDTARKIVQMPVEVMTREGFTLTGKNKGELAKLESEIKKLNLFDFIVKGLVFGRLYGGCLLFMGANDFNEPSNELAEQHIESLKFFELFDKRSAAPHTYYSDLKSPKFDQPKTYECRRIKNSYARDIHETRIVKFDGALTDEITKYNNQYWDDSVLQNCYQAICAFDEIYHASRIMMTESSQSILKVKGLLRAIASDQEDSMKKRAILFDTMRSITRTIFLDADSNEEYSKIQTNFSGIGEVLTHAANRLASACGIPVTVLMGQSPAGLNATGASDIRLWYDSNKSRQRIDLQPKIQRILSVLAKALKIQDPFSFIFNPLWQETPQEFVARQKAIAEIDQIYINSDVASPDEIRLARFANGVWKSDLTLPRALDEETGQRSFLVGHVTAAQQIVEAVARLELPRDAALGQLKVLLQVSEAEALEMLGSAGTDKFKVEIKPEA